MGHIDWLVACDLAYFDRHARLCIVGINTSLVLPETPVNLHQIMLVAKVTEPHPDRDTEIGVSIATPSGLWAVPASGHGLQIEVAAGYVLVTFRDLVLEEEGAYRLSMYLGDREPVTIDLPVFTAPPIPQTASIH